MDAITAHRSSALLTDRYELTMLQAALRSGAAHRRSVFEVFTRRLPNGRRYYVRSNGKPSTVSDDAHTTFFMPRKHAAWNTL